MTKKGREFNEIYDLTAMRVIVDSVKDCYGAVGVIHSLWKPLPGRFKDFIAMPKFNMYQSLHTTVIGPEGLPLEIQIRTREMHDMAEFGVAAHWIYKARQGAARRAAAGRRAEAQVAAPDARLAAGAARPHGVHGDAEGRPLRRGGLRLHAQGRGQVAGRRRHAAGLRLRGPHRDRPPLRRRARQRQDRAAALRAEVRRHRRDPHLQARSAARRATGSSLVKTTRARNKIQQWFKAESREDTEHTGRVLLQEHLNKRGLPAQKISGSPLLADVIREMGFRKADDFYIALGGAKISPKVVVNKVLQRLKEGEAAEGETTTVEDLVSTRRERRQPTRSNAQYGIRVEGVDDVMLRLAKCCHPVPGDPIAGYISLGRGITIHRDDCPNVGDAAQGPRALRRRVAGRATTRRRSRSRSRSTPTTARGCSRSCRGRSPRPASTSSRRAASSRRRWSRTGSSSRSATRRR